MPQNGRSKRMQPNQRGFTLLELTVVLVLMAIIGAYVAGRSITTDQIYLAGQVDTIRNHIRYAQSMAMKRTDTVWGIHNNAGQYWFFQTNTGNPIILPGEENAQVTLAELQAFLAGRPDYAQALDRIAAYRDSYGV